MYNSAPRIGDRFGRRVAFALLPAALLLTGCTGDYVSRLPRKPVDLVTLRTIQAAPAWRGMGGWAVMPPQPGNAGKVRADS
jgi:hypothetical protein